MSGPDKVWLDRAMQPWRVWTIEMTDLPEYVRRAPEVLAELPEVKSLVDAAEAMMRAYAEPDRLFCCNGHHCGCRGVSVREMADYHMQEAIAAIRAGGKP